VRSKYRYPGEEERDACNLIGKCSNGEKESSCASTLPVRDPENIEAARRRETNASDPLAAPEAAGRRETNAPCPKETAKSTGAWETNVPEERSATVRRDGEPLASAAKKRRQKEAAADRHQAAAGGATPCMTVDQIRATIGNGPQTRAARHSKHGPTTGDCCTSRPSRNLTRRLRAQL
jgi:hypothetical protein